jgi:hypothetical protein
LKQIHPVIVKLIYKKKKFACACRQLVFDVLCPFIAQLLNRRVNSRAPRFAQLTPMMKFARRRRDVRVAIGSFSVFKVGVRFRDFAQEDRPVTSGRQCGGEHQTSVSTTAARSAKLCRRVECPIHESDNDKRRISTRFKLGKQQCTAPPSPSVDMSQGFPAEALFVQRVADRPR